MRREDKPMDPVPHPDDVLTARERDVLQWVAHGFNNRSIASQLVIAEKTVEYRLTCIFAKLGVTTRTQAALWAIQHGLVSLDDLGDHLMREA
jgi:DNA-binding NarL/FixJ family response regulator